MFGFSKWNKAVDDATQYCTVMFSELDVIYGRKIPNQVFGDPYVLGFLQQLIILAATQTGQGQSKMMAVAEAAFNRLLPGFGSRVGQAFKEINNAAHPHHVNYQVGCREGREYVLALRECNTNLSRERMQGFRNFVARNYLGVPNSN